MESITDITAYISSRTQVPALAVKNVLELKAEGATLAFMARYRKDKTGNLDEVSISAVLEAAADFEELEKRRSFILGSIAEQGKLSNELETRIRACMDKDVLEDLYLPYKQRKKTRADAAREKGLEPLAKIILSQRERDLDYTARRFTGDKVNSVDEAIKGASDIIAQWIADDADSRDMLRRRFEQHAVIESKLVKGKEKAGEKYRDYFAYTEKASRAASHRIMAIMRAEEEGILRLNVEPDQERSLEALDRKWIRRDSACRDLMEDIVSDAYKRLLQPSLENEMKHKLFAAAESEAIRVFASNLSQLLLSAPLGNKRIAAIDPGIRSGCKVVFLDEYGGLLHHTVLFFNSPSEKQTSAQSLRTLIRQYGSQAIAVGNGTAGRETADVIKASIKDIPLFMVNEDGASVYSVSETARREFPNHDVTVKGAVSIGRRLMDPLAELVKIDAKSIGVGQYQHDVNQTMLRKALDETVESCVNKVGVNVNTAGEDLLKYVSGLGPLLAKYIVAFRAENGRFRSRSELKKVPRLGEKAFEQCAGFLRVPDSDNPLDNSAVHPEQYEVVNMLAKRAGKGMHELVGNASLTQQLKAYTDIRDSIGEFTFGDILKELEKPGLDPRESLQEEVFDNAVRSLEDLIPGMLVNGIVNNITNFGAFVDIGIKESGLLHVSEMSDKYIKDPNEIVRLNQKLSLKVKEVDQVRRRISLTLKM